MPAEIAPPPGKTPEAIRHHYEVERELADRLRNATRQQRGELYSAVYQELYRRVPLHPQLTRKVSPEESAAETGRQLSFLKRFLTPQTVYLEVGAGDCALAIAAAEYSKESIAIDVSEEISRRSTTPANFRLILSDGCSIPVPNDSIHVAYSNQLMEHLHPDDATDQLTNIFKALAPGGRYICITPNRLTGPHDVSKHFDPEATGFHLKEYTNRELKKLFLSVGFRRVEVYVSLKSRFARTPVWLSTLCEWKLGLLPRGLRNFFAKRFPCRTLLETRFVGIK